MPWRPLVSVVTPFLDAERFLATAVASVRAQTYGNWELILVDDGSVDRSPQIARDAESRDPERVRCLEHPGRANRGPAASRDLALREARGDLIAFLDADDLFLPFKLERQVAVLERHSEAGLVAGGALFWHSPELPSARLLPDFVPRPGLEPGRVHSPPELLTAILRDEDVHPANCAVLVRRRLCEEVGGYATELRLYEDTAFLAKLLLAAPVAMSADCTSVYRVHPDSACHRAEARGDYAVDRPNHARQAFLDWLDAELNEREADAGLRAALASALHPYRHPRRAAARASLLAATHSARRIGHRVAERAVARRS